MSTLAEHMIVVGAENRPHMLDKSMYNSWQSQKLQDDCDIQETNIVLQGLPPDVYSLVNHCQTAKDIWDRVKLLMQGTELSYQERECKLYNLTSLLPSRVNHYMSITCALLNLSMICTQLA
ncbi:hypothetical protein Tco_0265058 [Tanacetum coccineum]